jgi:hypothetical protein
MTKYILRERKVRGEPGRTCVVLAGDKEEAMYKVEKHYGGNWDFHSPHSTIEELEEEVEDSPSESTLLNL